MAISKLGYGGVMTDSGTIPAKSAGTATASYNMSRYRYRYAMRVLLFMFGAS